MFVSCDKVWSELWIKYCLIKSGTDDNILMNISTMFIFIKSFIELLTSLFIFEFSSINLLNIGKIPFSHKTSLKVTLLWTTFLEQVISSNKNNYFYIAKDKHEKTKTTKKN